MTDREIRQLALEFALRYHLDYAQLPTEEILATAKLFEAYLRGE